MENVTIIESDLIIKYQMDSVLYVITMVRDFHHTNSASEFSGILRPSSPSTYFINPTRDGDVTQVHPCLQMACPFGISACLLSLSDARSIYTGTAHSRGLRVK